MAGISNDFSNFCNGACEAERKTRPQIHTRPSPARNWVPFVIGRIFCHPAPIHANSPLRTTTNMVTYVRLIFQPGFCREVGQFRWVGSKNEVSGARAPACSEQGRRAVKAQQRLTQRRKDAKQNPRTRKQACLELALSLSKGEAEGRKAPTGACPAGRGP